MSMWYIKLTGDRNCHLIYIYKKFLNFVNDVLQEVLKLAKGQKQRTMRDLCAVNGQRCVNAGDNAL